MKPDKKKIFRQGDVLIVESDKTAAPVDVVKRDKVTLALGEVTGHHHSIASTGCTGYASETDDVGLSSFLVVEEEQVELTHQEHSTINIPAGNYDVHRQVEYTPSKLVNVAD